MSKDVIFTTKYGIRWLEIKLAQYPELYLLLSSYTTLYLQGCNDNPSNSWSRMISGKQSVEFDKTVTSLLCLDLIFDGTEESYEFFISAQTISSIILSFQAFGQLNALARSIVKDDILSRELIETNVIIKDMGKAIDIREKAKQYDIINPDPHAFVHEVLTKCGEIFPSFIRLNSIQQNIIKNTDVFHFGHISHIEGGIEMFDQFLSSSLIVNTELFNFKIVTDILEIAGCNGHLNTRGSTVFNQKTFDIVWAVKNLLSTLQTSKDPIKALKEYIDLRGQWLGLIANEHFFDQTTVTLTKIGCMMRLDTSTFGVILKDSFANLSSNYQTLVNEEFNPLVRRKEATPTYIPNFLVNFQSEKLKTTTLENALATTIKLAVPFVAQVLHQYRQSGNILDILSFNDIAHKIFVGLEVTPESNFTIQSGIVTLLQEEEVNALGEEL